jgi:tetratricopeptide (TPR) repeat protein
VPAAAVLVAFCLIGAIVLATAGDGGGEKSDRAQRGESGAERPASGRKKGSEDTAAGESGGGGGAAAAPAAGSGQTGSGTGGTTQSQGQTGSSGSASPAALNDQGFRLMRAGQYDEAIPILQRAVNAYPSGSTDLTYAFALYNLGRSLRLAGRPKEAIPILERRLRIPNQTETVRQELEAARRAAG